MQGDDFLLKPKHPLLPGALYFASGQVEGALHAGNRDSQRVAAAADEENFDNGNGERQPQLEAGPLARRGEDIEGAAKVADGGLDDIHANAAPRGFGDFRGG